MLLSFRPLVSVSVLTLLGWCWYSFRRRRTKAALRTEEEECFSDRGRPVHSSSVDTSVSGRSDLKMDNSTSGSSEIRTFPDTSPVLDTRTSSSSPVMGLKNRVRPEPEGEVSVRFRTEREKDSVAGDGDPDWGEVSEIDSGLESDPVCFSSNCFSTDSHSLTGQQPGPVRLGSYDGSSLSELSPDRGQNQENTENISPVLVHQVTADDRNNKDPSDTHALTHTQESPQEQSISGESLNNSSKEKLLSHSGASAGEDSGWGFCFSEEAPGAEGQTSEMSEDGQSCLTTPAESDTASRGREGENEARRGISVDAQVSSLTPPPAPPIILWDIEVPAHLVGRLIGKQGKFVNFLKQNSGAKIYVSTLPFTQDIQICHIQGSQQQVDDALSLIRKKFKDLDLSNCVPLPCLPITSWLLLPQDVFVEVTVSRVEAAHHLFIQQHKHPSYQALPILIQHMQFCYSQPGCPSLPTPVEVGVVCAAPVTGSGWQRAQVVQYNRESDAAHIRYVDTGGYDIVNSTTLRQIRSDFVTLPFQAAEVLLDNITPLPGEEDFSLEAKAALEELTANMALILKVTGNQDGLPLVHMWKQTGDDVLLVNRSLADGGFCSWFETQ